MFLAMLSSVALSEVVKVIVGLVIAISAKWLHNRHKNNSGNGGKNMGKQMGTTDNAKLIREAHDKIDDLDERVTKMESVLFGYDEYGLFEGYITIMENHDDEIQENAMSIEENSEDIDTLKEKIDECEDRRQRIVERVEKLVDRVEERHDGGEN